jgi:hypothetical protein
MYYYHHDHHYYPSIENTKIMKKQDLKNWGTLLWILKQS